MQRAMMAVAIATVAAFIRSTAQAQVDAKNSETLASWIRSL